MYLSVCVVRNICQDLLHKHLLWKQKEWTRYIVFLWMTNTSWSHGAMRRLDSEKVVRIFICCFPPSFLPSLTPSLPNSLNHHTLPPLSGIFLVADGNAEFTKTLGFEKDATGSRMGVRSKRYALIVESGKVTSVNIDEKGLENSSVEKILAQLWTFILCWFIIKVLYHSLYTSILPAGFLL